MNEDLHRPDFPQSALIVDEDEVVLKTLSLQLQDQGWDVVLATTAVQAIKRFQDHPTAVALISVGLSDMAGMELAVTLRRQIPDLIVILMTGYPTLSEALAGLHHEAFGYLVKPFRIEQLMLGIKRARRELALIRENRELTRIVSQLRAELAAASKTPAPEEEKPAEPAGSEVPLPATPYADYPGKVAGSSPDAIASYERQIRPASPESHTEEQPDQPETEQKEGAQSAESDQ